MKKLLILFCIALAAPLFTACSKEDNPVEITDTDYPNNVVTDQPAN